MISNGVLDGKLKTFGKRVIEMHLLISNQNFVEAEPLVLSIL